MKSRRRHELKQNVLADELGKVGGFIKKRSTALAWGVLIVAILLCAIYYTVTQGRAAARRRESLFYNQVVMGPSPGLQGEDPAEDLKSLVAQDSDESLAALAAVAVGDTYAARLVGGWYILTDSARKELTEQAESWYRRVINQFAADDLAVAKAHYGLAKLAESRRDFDVAEEEYNAVRRMQAALQGQPVLALAEEAIRQIAAIRDPVRMATTAPAETPETGPATAPAATQPTTGPAGAPAPEPTTRPAGADPAGAPPAEPAKTGGSAEGSR